MVSSDHEEPAKRQGRWKHLAGVLLELAFNIALPVLIYIFTKERLGDVQALMLASAPAIVWSLLTFMRERKLDAISLLVLTGIALSLVGFVGGGGVKFLQLRENLVTGLVGLIFLGSAALNRPLILHLARAGTRRVSHAALERFDALRQVAGFRRAMMVETLVWAFGLIAASALNCALVFMLPIETFLLVSAPVSYLTIGLLTAFTYWHVPRAMKAAEAQLSAAAPGNPVA